MADTQTQQWKQQRTSHWLPETWSRMFLQALRSMDLSGSAGNLQLDVQTPNPGLWAEWGEPLWLQLDCEAAEGAFLIVGCAGGTAQEIAKIIVGETEVAEQTARETYHELLGQSGSLLGTAASSQARRISRFGAPAPCSPPSADDAGLGVEFRFRVGETNHLLALVPSTPMITLLYAEDRLDASEDSTSQASPQTGPELSETAKYNLELLLEVELDLSISFGETVLPLRDVLKLASGSIVELNRSAADPVDLLVNNSVIARGEVVVVDGNYGVRVTEIVSRKERIRSIF